MRNCTGLPGPCCSPKTSSTRARPPCSKRSAQPKPNEQNHSNFALRAISPDCGPSRASAPRPAKLAEELIAWVEETDVDGFNIAYAVTPESFADFVDLVVPELQRRGRYKLDYAPGTLREKLYGPGRARLGRDHPAARIRGAADRPSSR
jgi:hypothetical protein